MRNKPFITLVLCALFLIPGQAQELLNYPLDTVNGEEVYRYPVERSIGLYRIGVNFNVPQSEIIRLNPQLRERGLHYGEILLLPTGRKVEEQVAVTPTVQDEEEETKAIVAEMIAKAAATADSIGETTMASDSLIPETRRVIELALMLPFESLQVKRSGNAERMLEFYQGALLALRDVQNDSTLYRLHVYDTERSERRVQALCDSTQLDSMDGILGLVYPIQIERMAEWCDAQQVPLLLPFSDETDVTVHPQVLQFNATDKQEADSICAWIARQENTHCVAITTQGTVSAWSLTFRKQLKAKGVPYVSLSLRDLMNDSSAYALDSTQENLILLHHDRYQNVRLVLPHLEKLQQEGFRIRIVSQYSWLKESIALPQVYTSMFTSNSDRTAYDEAWQQFYVNEHVSENPRYDLLGYDLMRSLISHLQGESAREGLQSDIYWEQIENGGYQNTGVHVVAN